MTAYRFSRWSRVATASAAALLVWTTGANGQVGGTPISVQLPGLGHDVELDTARGQLYVSVPDSNEIVVVSLASQSIVDSFFAGQLPRGIDLSDDGSTLYVALNASGSVAYLDIDTGHTTTVQVGGELDDPQTWDVVQGKPDRVYVSANPGSGGFAYIVQIKVDEGNAASRVANEQIIRCAPVFEDSPDDEFLYIGECFSPNSLYKLDLADETAPIILEDDHGSVDGTDHLEVNRTGTRIYLRSGQVLRTSTFLQDGLITPGPAQASGDGTKIYVATEPDTIVVHDAGTYLEIDTITLPCSFANIETLRVLPRDTGFLVLGDDILCGIIDAVPVSVFVSPPTGQYISTQSVDLVVAIGWGESGLASMTLTMDGIDRTSQFRACALPGFTEAGEYTLRCPGWVSSPGSHELVVSVVLDDGSELEDSVVWEVAPTSE